MAVSGLGTFVLFVGRLVSSTFWPRPRLADILEQTLAALRLGWRPIVAVNIPFGMAFSLNFESLLGVVGARSIAGGALVPAVVRQGGPLIAAIIAAAAVGSAFCADLGARTVRDEVAAHEVMGVDPVARLAVPKVVACLVAVPILTFFAVASSLAGGYFLIVVLRGGNAGQFMNGIDTILRLQDVVFAVVQALVFGLVVGLSATYFGLRAKGGPTGVARQVQLSIIASFVACFASGYLLTSLFYTT